MLNIIKTLLFIIVNIAGWYTIPVVAGVSMKIGVFPEFMPGSVHDELFKFWFGGVGMWVWLGCFVVSISYFFLENEWKNWILLSPMFVTGIYGIATVVYFAFIYSS